jgi:hypothetical protein
MPHHTDRVVEAADMEDCKVTHTPEPTLNYSKGIGEAADQDLFRRVLGMANYMAVSCRSDIAGAVSRLATKVSNPDSEDMRRLKHLVKYIKGTKEEGIIFRREEEITLTCYVDASFDSHSDSKSHTGYCFFLGNHSGAFYCRSTKQSLVANSSTEAEVIALFEAAKDVIWLRHLLADLGFKQAHPTVVLEDNLACMAIAEGRGTHSKIKHYARRFNFLLDIMKQNVIKLVHCRTENMVADCLTKPKEFLSFLRDADIIRYGHDARRPTSRTIRHKRTREDSKTEDVLKQEGGKARPRSSSHA